ncbi:DUF5403 family protein [Brevibacterium album]|uniref:DUF5403 family protein n=1 Tax=Brevibacterium album TaxID=417948 RepID=UPI00048C1C15|nr:DUF5403 family protein [Brevibacterium album]
MHIQWYYPRTGEGSVADIVSHLGGVQAELRSEARSRAAKAAALLNTRPKIRTGASQVEVVKGDLDYHVVLNDPSGKGGAAGIEERFGILAAVF